MIVASTMLPSNDLVNIVVIKWIESCLRISYIEELRPAKSLWSENLVAEFERVVIVPK